MHKEFQIFVFDMKQDLFTDWFFISHKAYDAVV